MYTIGLAAVGAVVYSLLSLALDIKSQAYPAFPTSQAPPASPQAAPADIVSIIQQIQQNVIATGQALVTATNDTVATLAKLAFVTIFVLGVFLYSTHLHKRLGKELMVGGIVLGVMAEVVIPAISKL